MLGGQEMSKTNSSKGRQKSEKRKFGQVGYKKQMDQ